MVYQVRGARAALADGLATTAATRQTASRRATVSGKRTRRRKRADATEPECGDQRTANASSNGETTKAGSGLGIVVGEAAGSSSSSSSSDSSSVPDGQPKGEETVATTTTTTAQTVAEGEGADPAPVTGTTTLERESEEREKGSERAKPEAEEQCEREATPPGSGDTDTPRKRSSADSSSTCGSEGVGRAAGGGGVAERPDRLGPDGDNQPRPEQEREQEQPARDSSRSSSMPVRVDIVPPPPNNSKQLGVTKSLLYNGSKFRGSQKSKGNAYEVEVVLQGKFAAFSEYQKTFNSDDFDYDALAKSDYVFMRWKEHFLVPDHKIKNINGASFAGFYYICFQKSQAVMEGYYYHRSSEWYQSLNLQHVAESCIQIYEFR
uniref:Uncharacterized protein n=1 Tax=Anopheles epiroticus TaxID=199890 RepID=A0A182PC12_9DIPT